MIRANGPGEVNLSQSSNTKCPSVCIYYKHSLAFRLLNIHYLKECINFEISFGDKICNVISLYHSPSLTLLKILQITLNKI